MKFGYVRTQMSKISTKKISIIIIKKVKKAECGKAFLKKIKIKTIAFLLVLLLWNEGLLRLEREKQNGIISIRQSFASSPRAVRLADQAAVESDNNNSQTFSLCQPLSSPSPPPAPPRPPPSPFLRQGTITQLPLSFNQFFCFVTANANLLCMYVNTLWIFK